MESVSRWLTGSRATDLRRTQVRASRSSARTPCPHSTPLTKDPAATYQKLIAGDYDTLGLALWGQINYDPRMNYTANAIT